MILKVVGAELRRARLIADLSQTALSELCGISSVSLSHYESGVRDIPTTKLIALAKALPALDLNAIVKTARERAPYRKRGKVA
jgi:transcriptional regulator with XRE-family HTH domain